MTIKILLPTEILVDEPTGKVIAEADNGAFCMLPRHADLVTALVPGVLSYWDVDGTERFAAIDEGTLVKCGDEVLVSTLNGVLGNALAELRHLVQRSFLELDDHERMARSALSRLEAGTLRRFTQMQGAGRV
jgi:F-type H+-transporting ATPase subunit epsilon